MAFLPFPLLVGDVLAIGGKLHRVAAHVMTEWNTFFPAGFNDDLRQRVYNLFNEALIEMCCADKPMTLKDSYVTYAKVIDKLNQLAEFGDYYVDLSEFSEPAM